MRCILLNVLVYSTVFLTIGTKLYSRPLEFFHLFYFFLAVLCGLWDLSSRDPGLGIEPTPLECPLESPKF